MTRISGILLAIETADCVAVLLADPEQRAVAAVHAGWRGTLRGIVRKTVGQMQMAYGTRPQDVLAVLGPGIARCCYEVGGEVAQAYASQFAPAREWFDGPFEQVSTGTEPTPLKWLSMAPAGREPQQPLRLRLDLIAANRWQLLAAGLKRSNIFSSDLCTACRLDLFFSYRRERGRTGRLMGVIGLRPGEERK
jgi:YfiH family protein